MNGIWCGIDGLTKSPDNKLRQLKTRTLQHLPNQRQDRREENNFPATQDISNPRTRQRAKQRANSKRRDDSALPRRLYASVRACGVHGVDLGEMGVPVAQGEKAADAGLIVPEEDE
jgi:hypothetical protein